MWFHIICQVWHSRLWSFKTRDTKLERFLHKNQHTQRKLLNVENWCSGDSFSISFSLKNTNLGAHFLFLLLKNKFWGSPLVQFSKVNKFLWVCWFLCKNLSNFVSLVLKLHNRECHRLTFPKIVCISFSYLLDEWLDFVSCTQFYVG